MMRKPDLIFLSLTETAKQLFGYEQVAKRIANIRLITERKGWKKDEENKNVYGSRSVYESFDIIRM